MQFNFNNMSKCISSLDEAANESYPTNTIEDMCSCLRNELNKFAPDFLCKEVIFTPNTDKQFFGIYIRPLWNSAIDFAKAIVSSDNDALKKVDSAIEKSMGQYGSAFNGLF